MTTNPHYPISFGAYYEAERSITLTADESIAQLTGPPGIPGSAPLGKGENTFVGKSLRFVKVVGPHLAGLATAADKVIGVLGNKPQNPGDSATVFVRGLVVMRAGGAIEAGDAVTCDAKGKAIKATTGAKVLGVAVTNVAGDDLQVSVFLQIPPITA